jgi:5'-3' exonuclease
MGILRLGTFLRTKFPELFRALSTADLRGKKIAIDMNHMLYQMFFRNGTDEVRTLQDLERLKTRLKSLDVTTWYVFDGNTAGLKQEAHKKRRNVRDAAETRLEVMKDEVSRLIELGLRTSGGAAEMGGSPSSPSPFPSTPQATSAMFPAVAEAGAGTGTTTGVGDADETGTKTETKTEAGPGDAAHVARDEPADPGLPPPAPWLISVLHAQICKKEQQLRAPSSRLFRDAKATLGPWAVVAKDDAERHVALMAAKAEVDFAVSADYDTLVFGSPNLVLNFLDGGGRASGDGSMTILYLEHIKNVLGFTTTEQFVDFCILCGCDMCEKPRNIGPAKAMALVLKYGSIEAMYDKELKSRLDNPDGFRFEFARQRFLDTTMAAHEPESS